MGNHHSNHESGSSAQSSASSNTVHLAEVRKSARSSRLRMAELWKLRRRSMGVGASGNDGSSHSNFRSFTYGQCCSSAQSIGDDSAHIKEAVEVQCAISQDGNCSHNFMCACNSRENTKKVPPRIEINGVLKKNSTITIMSNYEEEAANRKRKERCQSVENEEELKEVEVGQISTRIVDEIATKQQRRGSENSCGSLPTYSKHRAQKVDSRKICARKFLQRTANMHDHSKNTTASTGTNSISKCNEPSKEENELQHQQESSSQRRYHRPMMAAFQQQQQEENELGKPMFARSLDAQIHRYNTDICMEMKPLSIHTTRSMSPLLPLHPPNNGGQRGSFSRGITFKDGGILSSEQVEAIQQSWLLTNQRIQQFAGSSRCFGFFAFDRIFERVPELKPLFGISPNISLVDLDLSGTEQAGEEVHPFIRHLRIFTNIIDLTVRNAGELETEMFPALFTYGRRHYRPKIIEQFNERTVRLFCNQLVGTICDLLDDELSPMAFEAWVEMVTFLGRAILSGFEHERQSQTSGSGRNKRFSTSVLHKIHL